MTTQFDFNNDEWSDIAALPILVGIAVAKAEDSGLVGSYLETRALVHRIGSEAPDGPAQGLIEAAGTVDVKDKVEEFEQHDAALLADVAVTACREIGKVLDAKAQPAESVNYKQWVLDVGQHVADAAREHGVRVSPPEAALLVRIRTALDL